MAFPPLGTKVLEVSYSTHGYNGICMTRKRPIDWDLEYQKPYLDVLEGGIAQTYPYVPQTAGSWAPPLDDAEFILNHAAFERYLEKRGTFEKEASNKDLSEPRNIQSALLREGLFYRTITAGDWQASDDGQSLVWRESPFSEHEDFEISYILPCIRSPLTVSSDFLG